MIPPIVYDELGNVDGRANGLPIPHVLTFSAMLGSAQKAYWHQRYDEAVDHARADALVMEADCGLMGMLQERKLAVASLPWHLSVPNEHDPRQVMVRDTLQEALERTPFLQKLIMVLLEGLWYGRYGIQQQWAWGDVGGRRVLHLARWLPINGDKIGHLWDHTPYVLVRAGQTLPGADIITTTVGGRGLVLKGSWRERVTIHRHEVYDADFFRPERGEAIHGLGIRSRVFWLNWLRLEWLANLAEFIERVGLGVELWYYDLSNPKSKQETQEAAQEMSGTRTRILVPRMAADRQPGMERIETPTSGADLLIRLQQHCYDLIERYIVGQQMSSSSDGASGGLGNEAAAEFQHATKQLIRNYDANNLSETITGSVQDPGLISVMQRWSFPDTMPGMPGGFRVSFKLNLERSDRPEKLTAIKTVVDMGIKVKTEEVRSAAGLSKPDDGDETVGGQPPAGAAGQPPLGAAARGPGAATAAGKEPPNQESAHPANHQVTAPQQPPAPPGSPQHFATHHVSWHYAGEWNEQQHPRSDGGKFAVRGQGGKGSKGSKTPPARGKQSPATSTGGTLAGSRGGTEGAATVKDPSGLAFRYNARAAEVAHQLHDTGQFDRVLSVPLGGGYDMELRQGQRVIAVDHTVSESRGRVKTLPGEAHDQAHYRAARDITDTYHTADHKGQTYVVYGDRDDARAHLVGLPCSSPEEVAAALSLPKEKLADLIIHGGRITPESAPLPPLLQRLPPGAQSLRSLVRRALKGSAGAMQRLREKIIPPRREHQGTLSEGFKDNIASAMQALEEREMHWQKKHEDERTAHAKTRKQHAREKSAHAATKRRKAEMSSLALKLLAGTATDADKGRLKELAGDDAAEDGDAASHAYAADWDETKHPRADDGKFGHGSGSPPSDTPTSGERPSADRPELHPHFQAAVDAALATMRKQYPHERPADLADAARKLVTAMWSEPRLPDAVVRDWGLGTGQHLPPEATLEHYGWSKKSEEGKALRVYTGDGYARINKRLREGKPPEKRYQKTVENIQRAFAQAKVLSHPVTVWRGLSLSGPDQEAFMKQFEEAAASGGMVEMQGFTSTTRNPDVAANFSESDPPVMLEIKVVHGLDLEGLTQNQGEAELLLDHGSKFKVHGVRQVMTKVRGQLKLVKVIQLEQVPPERTEQQYAATLTYALDALDEESFLDEEESSDPHDRFALHDASEIKFI